MPFFGGGGKGKYECRVVFLDNNEMKYQITNKTFGDELLAKVFSALDLYEREYFGLRYKDRYGDVHWLDPNKTVKKQLFVYDPGAHTLYFGVKFYAADPTKLREEITRYQFFLQVKSDILKGSIPCEEKTSAELCAYCVQSELGDYDPALHTEGFISEFRFVPKQTPDFEGKIEETYQKLRGLIPAEAEMKFLERVKWLEMYGVDLHTVTGQDNMEYLLGLTPTGIVLFKNKNKIGSFIWPKITKLKYKGSCFLLRASQGRNDEEKEYTFICKSKDKAKNLWKNCAEHHTFFRLEKANDVPASAHNFLFRKGSGFKFSGRTQQEVERDADNKPRNQPNIQRKPSQRYNRRSTGDGRDFNDTPKSPISNASTISAPWEAAFTEQSQIKATGRGPGYPSALSVLNGLYSNGQRNSFPNRTGSSNANDRTSPKFPRRSGYSSSGEAETKRQRSHYYSGYTNASDVDSAQLKGSNKYGSAPNIQHKTHLHHQLQPNGGVYPPPHASNQHYFEDPVIRHHRHHSRESLHMVQPNMMVTPNGHDPRKYRPSGSKSDSEETTRRRRHQHYHQHDGVITDNEMVPALDVYHNAMGVALDESRPRRHRHHQPRPNRHRHSQFDPNSAEVLLELGPGSASSDMLNSDSDFTGRPTSAVNKENLNPVNSHRPNGYPSHDDPNYRGYHYPAHGMPGGHPSHRYLPQYLPAHLLKQGRPLMMAAPGGGMQHMYHPQYIEQYYHNRHQVSQFTGSHGSNSHRSKSSDDIRKSHRAKPKTLVDDQPTTSGARK